MGRGDQIAESGQMAMEKQRGFQGGSVVKNLLVNAETWVQSLDWEDP